MSRKATGTLINAPDEPVARFSPLLESYFEMLHRLVTSGSTMPDTITSIELLVSMYQQHYYQIRDHLEADDGISATVAEALPSIDICPLVKTLKEWEHDVEVGSREYQKRNIQLTAAPMVIDPFYRLPHYAECWRQYRLWLFEANRALDLCRTRIAIDAPEEPLRRYDWVRQ